MRVHSPPEAARGRFDELDGLRGIAAGMVVVYHFTSPFDGYFPGLPKAPFDFTEGAYGVQLFFLISGFVILLTAQRVKRPSDFLIARVSRLYPTYWAALSITLAFILVSGYAAVAVTPAQVAVNYTMLQRYFLVENVDKSYWTLAVELVFYGLMWLLLVVNRSRLTERLITRLVAGWLPLSAAVSWWVGSEAPSLTDKILLNVTIAEYAPLFCAGMLLQLSRSDGVLRPLVFPAGLVAAFNAALLHTPYDGLIVAFVFLAFTLVVVLPSVPWLASGPLQFLGSISYPLYLLHQVIGIIIIASLIDPLGRVPAMFVAAGVVVALAWVLHRVVEGPWTRAFRQGLIRLRDRLVRA